MIERELTPCVERVIALAKIEAHRDKAYVGTDHLLIGILLEGDNGAALILKECGITIETLRGATSKKP